MMEIEHPGLKPFEPELRRLLQATFGVGHEILRALGLKEGAQHNTQATYPFRVACLPSFKAAQIQIATLLFGLQDELDLADNAMREVINNRQLVLRRIMDAMVWFLIFPDRWLLRRLHVEGGIRPVQRDSVIPLLKDAMTNLHDNHTLALISDLTTVVQIGDLIEAQWVPKDRSMYVKFVEIKRGKVNELLRQKLDEPRSGTPASASTTDLKPPKNRNTIKQFERLQRQEQRLSGLQDAIDKDIGRHPMTGAKVKLLSKGDPVRDYLEPLSELLQGVKSTGVCQIAVDKCLTLTAFRKDQIDPDKYGGAAHLFFHLRNPGRDCTLKTGLDEEVQLIKSFPPPVDLVRFGLRSSLALPPLIWFPEVLAIDAVMDRLRVFAQFDIELFFKIASGKGLMMKWITRKEAERVKQAKLSGPILENRKAYGVRVENSEGRSIILGSRFFARTYENLTPPSGLLQMVLEMLDEIMPPVSPA